MLYSEDKAREIAANSIRETLLQNRSLQGQTVDEQSMLMLLSGTIRRLIDYINDCAKESCQWKDRHDALLKKKSGTDFEHGRDMIKLEQELKKANKEKAELLSKIERLKGAPEYGETTEDESEFVTIPKSQLEKMKDDLRKAEEKAKRAPATSNDSSLPPSKNPIGHQHKKRCSTRRKSGEKPGAKEGHKGCYHPHVKNPDRTELHYPRICPDCGEPICAEDLSQGTTRQVIDWPERPFPVIEHQLLEGHCKHCGHSIKGRFPDDVKTYFSFSPRFKTHIAYILGYLHIPVKRLSESFKTMFGINMSPGFIQNTYKEMADALDPLMEEIKKLVNDGHVNCLDESKIKVKEGDGKHWLWGNAALDMLGTFIGVYMALCDDRSHEQIEHICEDKKANIAVHDRKADYFNEEYLMCDTHQVCLEHLYRDCESVIKDVPECDWPKRFQTIIDKIIETKHGWLNPEDEPDITQLEKDLDALLDERPILEYKDHQDRLNTLIKGLVKVRPYLLTCLKHFAVPCTNNLIERAFRLLKCKLKVSGCFRTEEGAKDFVKIFCTIQNARLWGINPIELISKEVEKYKQQQKIKKQEETKDK